MSSRINVGKVAPIPKGNWVQSQSYEKLNMVNNGGVLYIAKEDVPANTAITNTNYWMPASGKFSIGTVETVSSSTGASATITDGAEGPILNLNIPRGVTGNESIDDTKGEGDTDYVWSADKTAKITNDLYNDKLDTTKTTELNGSIVTFEAENDHAIKDLTVAIEPVQDLHGYDNPWPAGGGANQWDEAWELGAINSSGANTDSTTSIRSTNYIPVTAGQNYYIISPNNLYVWGYDSNKAYVQRVPSADGVKNTSITIPEGISYLRFVVYITTYGNNISINYPSTVTTYQPYSNICPISGWDKAVVTRTDGQNILDYTDATKTYDSASLVITPNSDGISVRYSASSISAYRGADFYKTEGLTSILASGKSYTLSWHVSGIADGKTFGFGLRNQSNNSYKTGFYKSLTKDGDYFITFTYTDAVGCYLSVVSMAAFNYNITLSNLILAESDFVTFDLDGTRYGGTLDVLTGQMTVNRAYWEVSENYTWRKSANYAGGYYLLRTSLNPVAKTAGKLICSHAKTVSGTSAYVKGTCMMDGSVNIRIMPEDSTLDDWNNYIIAQRQNGTPINICYTLASPFTVQLSPSQMQTLLGENHLWADVGDTTVTLRLPTGDLAYQDTVDYETQVTSKPDFAAMLSGSETSMVATQNYNEGELIGVGENLYKTLTGISTSTTLTVGSNVVATTIEAELALKANSSSVYTKTETDTLLDAKADTADVYDKTETDIVVRDANTAATGHLSGSIVSFNDGADSAFVKDLSVAIEPVQDLHGYDNPWPAGGNTNLIDIDKITSAINASKASQYAIYLEPGVYYAYRFAENVELNSKVNFSLDKTTWTEATTDTTDPTIYVDTLMSYYHCKSKITVVTACWVVLYAQANSTYPMSCMITSDETYYASAAAYFKGSTSFQGGTYKSVIYRPYSNICPISGHTSATVTRTGKNLFDVSAIETKKTLGADGAIGNSTLSFVSNAIPVEGILSISIKYNYESLASSSSRYIVFYSSYNTDTSTFVANAQYNSPTKSHTISVPANAVTARISLDKNVTDISIADASTIQTVTFDLDGTRYGGTLDVLTGLLTVDRGYREFDGTETYWKAHVNIPSGFYIDVNGDYYKNNYQSNFAICNQYKQKMYSQITNVQNGEFGIGGNGFNRLIFKNTNATTVEEWQALVVQNPIHVVYKLASPVTVPLTPSQMQTLLGENHILADTGDVEVTYCKDTETYVASEINAHHDDTKATVVTKTASGSIISFTDGAPLSMEDLTISIEPVQDLHGYDAPWPAGGGKNLCNPDTLFEGNMLSGAFASGTNMIYYIPVTEGETYTISRKSAPYTLCTAFSIDEPAIGISYTISGTSTFTNHGNTALTASVTAPVGANWLAAIISTDDQVIDFQFEKGSTATEIVPYSNICPISGHTSATVTRTGKNLYDVNTYPLTSGYSINYPNGASSAAQDYACTLGYIPVTLPEGTVITLNHTPGGVYPGMSFYDTNKNVIAGSGGKGNAIPIPANCAYMRFTVPVAYANGADVQLELGSTASAYEPYQGQTVTISLGEEYYGGTLDVTTGMLTVTHKKHVVTESDVTSGYQAGYSNNGNRIGIIDDEFRKPDSSQKLDVICNMAIASSSVTGSGSWKVGECLTYTNNNHAVFFCIVPNEYDNATKARKYLADNGCEYVAPLATPFTVQLTPSQLSTLLGENHIFVDTGDTSVTYRADTKLYIDQAIAESQKATRSMITTVADSMVAPTNLTNGQIIIVGDDIYKLTTNISSGANLVVGTNCQKATLAEWVTALTA